jgi:epsilon-lactone hydrolase
MSHDSAPPVLQVGPRSIPIPKHISTEAQAMMAAPSMMSLSGDYPPLHDTQGWREHIATVNNILLHRALHRAQVPCELHVFEALSHGFNVLAHLPEAREATLDMIRFFDQQMDER